MVKTCRKLRMKTTAELRKHLRDMGREMHELLALHEASHRRRGKLTPEAIEAMLVRSGRMHDLAERIDKHWAELLRRG